MIHYEYNKSKTLDDSEFEGEVYFLVNSLIEKRKYIYFRRGPFGTLNYECGTEHFKMRKRNLTWEKLAGRECNNGSSIYKVARIT